MTQTDLVIDSLSTDVAALAHDLVAYRKIAQAALTLAADLVPVMAAQKRQLEALKDELRRYTAAQVGVGPYNTL